MRTPLSHGFVFTEETCQVSVQLKSAWILAAVTCAPAKFNPAKGGTPSTLAVETAGAGIWGHRSSNRLLLTDASQGQGKGLHH